MTIIYLKMPEKLQEITVKVVKAPYEVSNDIFCDVRLFGDPNRSNEHIFRMKISKTLWHSLYKALVERFELGGDAGDEIDSQLECITGKIMTVSAKPDIKRAYATKNGKLDSPKIFDVYLREDLEELERIGGDDYINAVNRTTRNNRSYECYKINIMIAKEKLKGKW